MKNRKILVISHNVFDRRTNMGKTLSGFFTDWNPDRLAQLYLHSEIPTSDICHKYYRITDTDALKSVFWGNGKRVGRPFSQVDIDANVASSRTDKGIKRKIYSFGRKRTSFIYAARNAVWHASHWYSESLKNWIADFSPDVIFFAAGDYAFLYDLAYIISRDFDIPIVMYCCDDFFINRRNPESLLGFPVYWLFMKHVRRCISRTAEMVTICEKMADAYRGLFDIPIQAVYTGYSCKDVPDVDGEGIVYLGNLGACRGQSLVDIGKALRKVTNQIGMPLHLDVYSAETKPDLLNGLSEENGILFHGAVDREEVRQIIAKSRLVVHTESFAKEDRQKVMFSISTKIADLLASGRCIFAYGPDDVASMEYLAKNHAACVVDHPERLEETLTDILTNREGRSKVVHSAMMLADRNHDPVLVQEKIRKIIERSCGRTSLVSLERN